MHTRNEQVTGPDADRASPVLLEVSNAMVALYKDQFGRGPTRARTAWAGPDVLICTLEDSFTPAERKLTAMGEHQRLRDMRAFMQYATTDGFKQAVEAVTGRRVRAFVSGTDATSDVSSEVFYLEPLDGDGAEQS